MKTLSTLLSVGTGCATLLAALPFLSTNQAPIVQTDPVVIAPCDGAYTIVQLDASDSFDPDGDTLRFLWRTNDPRARFLDAHTAQPVLIVESGADNCLLRIQTAVTVGDGQSNNTERVVVAIKPQEDCCEEGEPVDRLEFVYTGRGCDASDHQQDPDDVQCSGDPMGASPVRIRAFDEDKPHRVYFDDTVDLGGKLIVDSAMAGEEALGDATVLEILDSNGAVLQNVRFDTSCDAPIRRGNAFGALSVSDCPDCGCTDCCEDGNKPAILTMRYTGEACGSGSNSQSSDKYSCSGDPGFASPVYVTAVNKDGNKVFFDDLVELDASFDIDAGLAGEDKLDSETWIYIHDLNGNQLQEVRFHTSCSQPLDVGDQFGSFVLTGCRSEGSGNGDDLCKDGKPAGLVMTYTGEDCSASNNGQDPGKATCTGDPAFAPLVRIVASKDGKGQDIYFDQEVALDTSFTIRAAGAGEDKLSSSTRVEILDIATGDLLQELVFHTSCSQPLVRDDQFGALRLDGIVKAGGGSSNRDYCALDMKPQVLRMGYTGRGCSASKNAQDSGKTSCSGDANEEARVRIVASDDKEDQIYFDGEVDLNTLYTIDAKNAGKTKLKSNLLVKIYDLQGNLLEEVEFHASCSQPLRQLDQFGSNILLGISFE